MNLLPISTCVLKTSKNSPVDTRVGFEKLRKIFIPKGVQSKSYGVNLKND